MVKFGGLPSLKLVLKAYRKEREAWLVRELKSCAVPHELPIWVSRLRRAIIISSFFGFMASFLLLAIPGVSCFGSCPVVQASKGLVLLVLLFILGSLLVLLFIHYRLTINGVGCLVQTTLYWTLMFGLLIIPTWLMAYDPGLDGDIGAFVILTGFVWMLLIFSALIDHVVNSFDRTRLDKKRIDQLLDMPVSEIKTSQQKSENSYHNAHILPVILVVISVIAMVIMHWPEGPSFRSSPDTDLWLREPANETIVIDVVKANPPRLLELFSYQLVDNESIIIEYGVIGIQKINGLWQGIDVTWDRNTSGCITIKEYCYNASYPDPESVQHRIDDVLNGSQTNRSGHRNEGHISVFFRDRDLNGKLSPGDRFEIRNDRVGLAPENPWSFRIRFDPLNEIVSTVELVIE